MRRSLTRLWNFLIYGGSTRLRSYEGAVLEALVASLGPSDAAAVRAQLAGLDHVKRLHRDRMVTLYFYQPKRLPRIENRGEALHVGAYRVSGTSIALTAVVFAHRGLLSSLEFTMAPAGLEHAEVVVETVRTKGRGASLASNVDRMDMGARPEAREVDTDQIRCMAGWRSVRQDHGTRLRLPVHLNRRQPTPRSARSNRSRARACRLE